MFRYPGGKSKAKKVIVSKINKYYRTEGSPNVEYVEPFFGSGSIAIALLNSTRLSHICINDMDGGIACFWNAVIHYPDELCKMVEEYTPVVEDFYSFKTDLRDLGEYFKAKTACSKLTEDCVRIGFKKLVIHKISFSGLGTMAGGPMGGREQKSDYKVGCRWNSVHIAKEIRELHELFSHVTIRDNSCTETDYGGILGRTEKGFFYLDPPYYEKGPELYQYHFQNLDDHQVLARFLEETELPWLLSYDNAPEIREMYKWAKITELDFNYSIHGATKKTELLITSPKYSYLLEDEDDIF